MSRSHRSSTSAIGCHQPGQRSRRCRAAVTEVTRPGADPQPDRVRQQKQKQNLPALDAVALSTALSFTGSQQRHAAGATWAERMFRGVALGVGNHPVEAHRANSAVTGDACRCGNEGRLGERPRFVVVDRATACR